MRTIITICIDDRGNIEVNYPKTLRAVTALDVMQEVINIVGQQHKQEEIAHRHHVATMKKFNRLLKKQKQPNLN